MWRARIEEAVALGQKLEVYYQHGMVGRGKVDSWEALSTDAMRRDRLQARRERFYRAVLRWAEGEGEGGGEAGEEQQRSSNLSSSSSSSSSSQPSLPSSMLSASAAGVSLSAWTAEQKADFLALSDEDRDDSSGGRPGSDQRDQLEALFLSTLSTADRAFHEKHVGLGNSQKAEVNKASRACMHPLYPHPSSYTHARFLLPHFPLTGAHKSHSRPLSHLLFSSFCSSLLLVLAR